MATGSVGLCLITKTYDSSLEAKVTAWLPYFNEIYIQVNGGPLPTNQDTKLHFSYFKWCDDFSAARNALLAEVQTEFWVWADTDDQLLGLDNLQNLLSDMQTKGTDALYLPYQYAFNELGECITLQWRERILRTDHPFTWKGVVHETLISDGTPNLDRTDAMLYRHQRPFDEFAESAQRNHKLLLKAYRQDNDPRTMHYLGLSYFNLKDFRNAIKLFRAHIKASGWDEEQYRSWYYIGQSYGLMNRSQEALEAALKGIELMPTRPECYVMAAECEIQRENYTNALEWLHNAATKKPPTNTLSPLDETYYGYRAEFMAVLCYMHLGQIKAAYEQMKSVLKKSPEYPEARNLVPLLQELYDEEAAITKISWLTQYLEHYHGRPEELFKALPAPLFMDVRLNRLRNQFVKPKQWSDKSIVFFCGESAEAWGPDTLHKGMGGSEEAVLYLSRELAKLGWEVTIFNERDDELVDHEVRYLPWTALNPNDKFNIIVSWRRPTLFSAFKFDARLKLVDLHDAPVGHVSIPQQAVEAVDKFMFKSQYQRQLASHIPDDKCVVAPNGIVPEHFAQKVKRNPKKVIYASTHDRGLANLLELWPSIKEQVPEAELHTYYGWNTFDALHKGTPEKMKWKYDMIRKMHRAGAIDHGRLSHEELAKEFLSAGVWTYPTQFPEISCITSMKAGCAGLESVTSGYAALAETQLQGFLLADNAQTDPLPIYKDKTLQKRFIEATVKALRAPGDRQWDKQYLDKYAWSNVAKLWSDVCGSVQ